MTARKGKGSKITVGDLSIPVVIEELPLGDVKYYSENPRIFSILKRYGRKAKQDEIERHLWELDSTKDLFRDIQRNGGLLEEILVRDGKVLEGNSRLCAYRRLLKRAKAQRDTEGLKKWSRIRAKILPSDTSEEAVFAILGILHVRGKAKWLPYEQASFLHRQMTEFGKSYAELSDLIGTTESEIKNAVGAYEFMDRNKITDTDKFSYCVEFVKSRKLKEAASKLPRGKKLEPLFVKWIDDEAIPRAERVRDLPDILNDQKARKGFLSEKLTFEEALQIAHENRPETTSSFYAKLKRATIALEKARLLQVKKELREDKNKRYVLKKLLKTVTRFCKRVELEPSPIGTARKRRGGTR